MSDIISGKLEIAVLIDSLDAVVASLLALLQLYGTLKRIQKLKEKLPFISKLNDQCFCSRTWHLEHESHFWTFFTLVYKTFTAISSNIHDLIKHK